MLITILAFFRNASLLEDVRVSKKVRMCGIGTSGSISEFDLFQSKPCSAWDHKRLVQPGWSASRFGLGLTWARNGEEA